MNLSCKSTIIIHAIKLLRMTNLPRAKQHLNLCGICNATGAISPLSLFPFLHHKSMQQLRMLQLRTPYLRFLETEVDSYKQKLADETLKTRNLKVALYESAQQLPLLPLTCHAKCPKMQQSSEGPPLASTVCTTTAGSRCPNRSATLGLRPCNAQAPRLRGFLLLRMPLNLK